MAKHADKTAPFIKACAKETNELFRGQALTGLAQLVAYARQSSTSHHLRPKEVEALDAVVRAGLSDSSNFVRQQDVMALAIMGTQHDLAILERIAATDPAFYPEIAAQGAQYDPYPVRAFTGYAIKRLQDKLKAQQ